MKTESDQKHWEKDMVSLGVTRFRATEEKAKQTGRFTDTTAGGRLMRTYLSQVSAEVMETVASKKTRNKYMKLLKGTDPDKLAMFALWRIIQCLYKPATLQQVTSGIGKMVEDELRFSKFEIEAPEYYNAVQRDLDARNSTDYKHRHRVLVSTMNSKDIDWNAWTNETHIGVGSVLLNCAKRASDLIDLRLEGGAMMVHPSDEAIEWVIKHDESIELMLPDRMPCIIQPRDWKAWKDGGFYSKKLSGLTPLVKTRSGQQRDTHGPLLDTAAMAPVLDSVNAMQRTSWRVNKRILPVLQEVWNRGLGIGMPRSQPYEIPPAPIPEGLTPKDLNPDQKERFDEWKAEARALHNMESERKSALMGTVRAMRMAARLDSIELLWIVYQLDFRGRTYSTTSGVSPQGSDVSKSLLEFGVGEKLTKTGWFWFQVHGANKYGYDKDDYAGRVKWVQDHSADFYRAGHDPIGNADVWKEADKPWQFLAWCMEYASCCDEPRGPEHFVSHMPVALDGSCNGLQHFSAMLRDPVGGKAVNLVPSERPADIYSDVASVATRELRRRVQDPSDPEYIVLANWIGFFDKYFEGKLNRKLTKKPVMTLPYGSTLQTCTQSVYQWYLEQKVQYLPEGTAFRHSIVLAKIIWQSIGEVVVAARAAMQWIQKVARRMSKQDEPIVYTSPIGFPMVQFSPNMDKKRIEAQIGGRVQIQIKYELPGVDMYKAASGSSPNFVHCVDSTHMHMVVVVAAAEGMTHFAMIHDDFGVHACYIERFHEIIREQFIILHSKPLLTDFYNQQVERTGIELDEPPESGTLDLEQVSKSLFFFG